MGVFAVTLPDTSPRHNVERIHYSKAAFFCRFTVFNLAWAIVVKMSASEEQLAYHKKKMRTHFKLLDRCNTGFVSADDFDQVKERLKECGRISEHDPKCRSLDVAFQAVTTLLKLERGRKTPIEEVVATASQAVFSLSESERRTMADNFHNPMFDALDANDNGFISVEEYMPYFYIFGHDISQEAMVQSFNTLDSDQDGTISRQEFLDAAHAFFLCLHETAAANTFFGELEA